MAPQTVYLNAATNPFGEHAVTIALNRWAVYNAPRPIPGEIAFQSDFAHGIFFAAGPAERYAQAWADLDAWPVELITNLQIVRSPLGDGEGTRHHARRGPRVHRTPGARPAVRAPLARRANRRPSAETCSSRRISFQGIVIVGPNSY